MRSLPPTRRTLPPAARGLTLALVSWAAAGLLHAQPATAPTVNASAELQATAQLLDSVNRARAEARDCGRTRFEAASPLRRQAQLDAAARAHVLDLAARGTFGLRGSDDSTTATRVEREGYRWSGVGENLIDRALAPEVIVQGWLADPMQCSNIMHPALTEVGLARGAAGPEADARVVWSMVVARPRTPSR